MILPEILGHIGAPNAPLERRRSQHQAPRKTRAAGRSKRLLAMPGGSSSAIVTISRVGITIDVGRPAMNEHHLWGDSVVVGRRCLRRVLRSATTDMWVGFPT